MIRISRSRLRWSERASSDSPSFCDEGAGGGGKGVEVPEIPLELGHCMKQSGNLLDPLINFCEQGISRRLFPGAALAIGNTETQCIHCVGSTTYSPETQRPITENTLFDLASLTKVIATASVARVFVESGRLSLDEPISERPELSVRHLLLHNSGLPPYRNFHLESPISPNIRDQILATPLEAAPGERVAYSCLGFVILQHVLERICGETLDDLFASLVARPLGIRTIRFVPTGSPQNDSLSIAPTTAIEEWRIGSFPGCPVRDRHLCGAVHDPIAFLQGGVSGNAGLFGDILGVAKFAQSWLRSLSLPNPSLSRSEKEGLWDWICPQAGSRALGWDTWSPGCSAGSRFSHRSFGHTGYTGTSIWIDPENDVFAVLLTNRVHPDDSSSLVEFRPKFHDLAFELMKGASLN